MAMSLWRDGEFLKFWIGQTVSDFGDQITLLALPLTAVIVLNAGPVEMGLLAAVASAPTALFSLFAGVWIDRLPRQGILVAVDLGRAILLATIPLAFVFGVLTMTQLYIVGFAVGTLSVVFVVGYQSYLPGLVGRQHLVDANGKMNASSSLAQLAGPGVAGVLVQLFTAPMPVILDAITYLASATGIALIRRPEPAVVFRPRDMRTEIREGLQALLGHPILRTAVTGAAMFILLLSAQVAIFVLYLSRDLGLDPPVIGAVFAAGAVGALLGAVFASAIARRVGIGPSFIIGGALVMIGLAGRAVVFGEIEATVGSIAVMQFVLFFAASLFNVNAPSLRQALTPSHLLGRVNASWRFLVWGTGPFGALLGGALGAALGLRAALLLAGLASLVPFLIFLFSPLSRIRDMPGPE